VQRVSNIYPQISQIIADFKQLPKFCNGTQIIADKRR